MLGHVCAKLGFNRSRFEGTAVTEIYAIMLWNFEFSADFRRNAPIRDLGNGSSWNFQDLLKTCWGLCVPNLVSIGHGFQALYKKTDGWHFFATLYVLILICGSSVLFWQSKYLWGDSRSEIGHNYPSWHHQCTALCCSCSRLWSLSINQFLNMRSDWCFETACRLHSASLLRSALHLWSLSARIVIRVMHLVHFTAGVQFFSNNVEGISLAKLSEQVLSNGHRWLDDRSCSDDRWCWILAVRSTVKCWYHRMVGLQAMVVFEELDTCSSDLCIGNTLALAGPPPFRIDVSLTPLGSAGPPTQLTA